MDRSTPPVVRPPNSVQPSTPPSNSPSTTPSTRNRTATMPHPPPNKTSQPDLVGKGVTNSTSFEGRRSARGSKDSLTLKPVRQSPSPVMMSSQHEELLKTLKTQFAELRKIVECKICYDPLYEPYTTSCGHTYCYLCFCKSFRHGVPPACPECRTVLSTAPAPAFLVREMTHRFVERVELLPPGETKDQHKRRQKEQADAVQTDKANTDRRTGGLFRGFFRVRPRVRPALRDIEDGVDRCPYCQWELEDGMCERCGLPFDENGTGTWDFSDLEEGSEHDLNNEDDLELEIDMDEEEDDFMDEDMMYGGYLDWHDHGGAEPPYALQRFLGNAGIHPHGMRARAAHSAAGSRRRSYAASVSEMADSEMAILEEEDEDEDGDEDSSMNDFIEEDDGMQGVSRTPSLASTSTSRASTMHAPESIEEGEEESSEDEGPIQSGRRRLQRNQARSAPAPPSLQRSGSSSLGQVGSNRRFAPVPPPNIAAESASASEEDEGPIAPGRRRHRSTQSQSQQSTRHAPRRRVDNNNQASQSSSQSLQEESSPISPQQQSPSDQLRQPISSVQSRRLASLEDVQSPSNLGYTPLGPLGGRVSREDEDDVDEGDDESDGRRTIAGWEPITIERIRNAGSLTPTADRPNPSNHTSPVRPGRNNVNHTVRPRSSQASVSSHHYEDNDADDDVSDGDPGSDTDTEMNRHTLRQPISQIRLRPSAPMRPNALSINNFQQQPFSDDFDVDSDETTTSSQSALTQVSPRRAEYNPRISMLFSQHQTDLSSTDYSHPFSRHDIEQLRATGRTPVARPRTSNRNRTPVHSNNAAHNAPLSSPGALSRSSQTIHNSPRNRNNATDGMVNAPAMSNVRANTHQHRMNTAELNHAPPPPNRDALNSSLINNAGLSAPGNTTRSFPQSANVQNQAQASMPHAGYSIERPMSRVSNRTPSNTTRRGAPAWPPFSQPQSSPMRIGLNAAQSFGISRNPFYNGAVRPQRSSQRLNAMPSQQRLRERTSQVLRTQGSNATLRQSGTRTPRTQLSQRNIREANLQQQRQQSYSAQASEGMNNTSLNPFLPMQRVDHGRGMPMQAQINPMQPGLLADSPQLTHQASRIALPRQRSRRGLQQEADMRFEHPQLTANSSPNSRRYGGMTGLQAPPGLAPVNSMVSATQGQQLVGARRASRTPGNALPGGFVAASNLGNAPGGYAHNRNGQSPSNSSIDSIMAGNMVRGVTTGGEPRHR
ncbi:hypothetical protein EJ08DRAFT_656855 [Tothia fuscella]|uniref:RING-type domain-containing protein n=1 Tax=Tothia fuscella TaxID=1048955 RepID=A0A9P4NZA4_9PEZI|nr:hypothetical protein EJ08DRAFT_656855 [Tothia fuscella]